VVFTGDHARRLVWCNPATAANNASLGSFLPALPRLSRRTRADSVAGTSTTSSPAATSCSSQQIAQPVGSFDRPRAGLEWCGPGQQPFGLALVGAYLEFSEHVFVRVEGNGGV
jgi:hypothetical protein